MMRIRIYWLEYAPRFGFVRYCAGSTALHLWPIEIKFNWGGPA